MSENLKRLKEEYLKKDKPIPYWNRKYESLSGVSNIERQIKEAREKEQRIKAEMKEEGMKVVEMIKADINVLIRDEEEAIKAYEKVVQVYGTYGWRAIFNQMLNDERRHLVALKMSLSSIDSEIKKYIG